MLRPSFDKEIMHFYWRNQLLFLERLGTVKVIGIVCSIHDLSFFSFQFFRCVQ